MFFWKASVIRESLRLYLPKTAAILSSIAEDVNGGESRKLRSVLKKRYPECESVSVDYAVLEKAAKVIGIPCDIGWNDVGSWKAAYDLLRTGQ